MRNGTPPRTSIPLVPPMLVLRVVLLVIAVSTLRGGNLNDDLARFHKLANGTGVPYRDVHVEYAPVEILALYLLGSSDPGTTGVHVAIAAFLSDLAIWAAVRFGWGPRAGARYLLLGAPLLLFIYTRFDLVPVAIASWAAAFAVKGHERRAGLVSAIAAMTKLWPLAIFPAYLVAGRRRAFWWAVGSTAIAGGAWLAVAGAGGVGDVLTFRHASGWGVESGVGAVMWITSGGPVRVEQGAPRIGEVSSTGSILAALCLVALWGAIWLAAARRHRGAFGGASLGAVAALLICSPLFSLQYAAWLLPWAAVAGEEGERGAFWTAVIAEVLTAVLFVVYAPDRAGMAQVLLLLRNGSVAALPLIWLFGPWARRRWTNGRETTPSGASLPHDVS